MTTSDSASTFADSTLFMLPDARRHLVHVDTERQCSAHHSDRHYICHLYVRIKDEDVDLLCQVANYKC